MALALVQKNKAGSTPGAVASLSCVFAATPTSGNLLVAIANADNVGSMTSSGWTLAISSINDSGLYQYWKIAGASEPTTVTWAPAASASTELWIAEYSGNAASSPLDKTAAGAGVAGGTTVPTGTTAATVQADELAIAAAGESGGASGAPSAWSNSFIAQDFQFGASGTVPTGLAVATKALSATGTQTSTATIPAAGVPSGSIATYKASGGPAPSYPTVNVTEGGLTAIGTSVPVTLPAGGAATDEYLVIMNIGSTSATLNALTDWTELLDENVASGLKIARYTGTGVPADPTFVTSASTRTVWIAYRITGADKTITPQIGTTSTGTSLTPDPPAITPTGGTSKDYLSIAFAGMAGEEADDDTWANTPPSGYTPSPPRQKSGGISGTNIGGLIMSAEAGVTSGAAIDPGTFNVDVSAAWRAQHILVHPAPSGAALTKNVDDTLTLADALTQQPGKVNADTLALADAFAKDVGKTNADTLTLADAFANDVSKLIADTLAFADSAVVESGKAQAIDDTLTLADSVSTQSGRAQNIDDTLTLADATVRDVQKVLADTLALVDAQAKDAAKPIADALTLADATTTAAGFSLLVTDTLGLADNVTPELFVAGLTQAIDDTLTLSDALTKEASKVNADTLALADAITRDVSKVIVDALALADSLSKLSSIAIGDTLAFSDTVTPELTVAGNALTQAINDSLTLADSLTKSIQVVRDDTLTLDDATALSASIKLADVLSLIDSVNTGGDKPWVIAHNIIASFTGIRVDDQPAVVNEGDVGSIVRIPPGHKG